MPTFWLGILLILVFAVYIPVLPSGGDATRPDYDFYPLLQQILDRIIHLILPVTAFVLNNFAIFTLIMRNSLIEELSEDYITTARAKGLSRTQQLERHAVPNARLPVATVVALYVGWIFSGAIVIEVVFDLNGLGLLAWNAVLDRDYPLLSAIFLVGTLGVIIANAILDIAYSYIDPRVTEA
jgi:peptide/nickel transport system permease protein